MIERLDEFRGNVYRFQEGVPATYQGEATSVVGVTDQRSSMQSEMDLVVKLGQRDFVVPHNEVQLSEASRNMLKRHVHLAGNTLSLLHGTSTPAATSA